MIFVLISTESHWRSSSILTTWHVVSVELLTASATIFWRVHHSLLMVTKHILIVILNLDVLLVVVASVVLLFLCRKDTAVLQELGVVSGVDTRLSCGC